MKWKESCSEADFLNHGMQMFTEEPHQSAHQKGSNQRTFPNAGQLCRKGAGEFRFSRLDRHGMEGI